ncbi:hypothetical protein BDW22DRAFT_1346483 [Trametopsis cervina]|nr:hypothetical protein BDW22DRAFT_1346483 [Trametopsis cervina]
MSPPEGAEGDSGYPPVSSGESMVVMSMVENVSMTAIAYDRSNAGGWAEGWTEGWLFKLCAKKRFCCLVCIGVYSVLLWDVVSGSWLKSDFNVVLWPADLSWPRAQQQKKTYTGFIVRYLACSTSAYYGTRIWTIALRPTTLAHTLPHPTLHSPTLNTPTLSHFFIQMDSFDELIAIPGEREDTASYPMPCDTDSQAGRPGLFFPSAFDSNRDLRSRYHYLVRSSTPAVSG